MAWRFIAGLIYGRLYCIISLTSDKKIAAQKYYRKIQDWVFLQSPFPLWVMGTDGHYRWWLDPTHILKSRNSGAAGKSNHIKPVCCNAEINIAWTNWMLITKQARVVAAGKRKQKFVYISRYQPWISAPRLKQTIWGFMPNLMDNK